MKISMTNVSLDARFGVKDSLRMIKEAGFDAVDYDLCERGEHRQLTDDFIEHITDVRAYMDELGLECSQVHAPFPFFYNEELELSNRRFLRMVRALEAASILGATYVVVHSIEMPKELFGETWSCNYKFYKALQPYAEKFGVRIAIENLYIEDDKRKLYHAPGRFSDPKIITDFIEALDSDVFCICLDTGHAALCGIEPWVFIDNLPKKELLCALHVHDVDYYSDTHTVPYATNKYKGIDWEATMHSLYKAGYQGTLNLETHIFSQNFPAPLAADAVAFSAKVAKYLTTLFK